MSTARRRARVLRRRLRFARRRFGQLTWTERRVLAEATALLPVVHAVQQRLPFRRWRTLLEPQGAPGHTPGSHAPSVEQIGWAVERARRWLPGVYKCLPAAYTVHLLMRRHGHRGELKIGVAPGADGKLEAHAWVVYQGRTVIGELDDLSRYAPLPPLPRGASRP